MSKNLEKNVGKIKNVTGCFGVSVSKLTHMSWTLEPPRQEMVALLTVTQQQLTRADSSKPNVW